MARRADIGFLRYNRIVSDDDFTKTVESYMISNPAVIPNRNLPRVSDLHRRSDDDATADLCSKKTQQPSAPSIKELRRPPKRSGLHQPPQLHNDRIPSPKVWRKPEAIQLLYPQLPHPFRNKYASVIYGTGLWSWLPLSPAHNCG